MSRMLNHIIRHKYQLLFILLIMIVSRAYALQTDKKEKVFIQADAGSYNYKTGIKVFEGHVIVNQGTSHLTADKLITKGDHEHQIKEAIAYGINTPAHYWTLTREGDPEIHANAKIIKFYPLVSNVTLEQDVVVIQGANSFKGQVIFYNRNDQTITVPASKNGRAVLIYDPDK